MADRFGCVFKQFTSCLEGAIVKVESGADI